MDRLDAMDTFVTVAEQRSFVGAARKLGLSPSAVTRTIGALEERLGVRLLQRTTRSVALTDAGQRYLLRARRILAEVDEAEGEVLAERATPMGRLAVAAPNAFGRAHVAPALTSFLARHESVVGELFLADRFVNLVDEGIDVAVRIGVLSDSSLVARAVGATRRVLVASPAYLKAHGTPRSPDALAERRGGVPRHRIVHFTALSPSHDWRFFRGDGVTQVTVTPSFATNSAEVAVAHVEAGRGLALVLAFQAITAVRAGRLVVVLPRHEPPPIPIQLVYPTSRLLSSKVRAFVDHVTAHGRWNFVEL
jgi:DNA-binding transcriptional LysR family regulator